MKNKLCKKCSDTLMHKINNKSKYQTETEIIHRINNIREDLDEIMFLFEQNMHRRSD